MDNKLQATFGTWRDGSVKEEDRDIESFPRVGIKELLASLTLSWPEHRI